MQDGRLGRGSGRPLRARTALPRLALLFAASLGCDRPDWTSFEAGGAAAGGGSGTAATPSGGSPGVISLAPSTAPCQLSRAGTPVFQDRLVSNTAPARRELYTWTTLEQAQELRASSVLFTRTEREGKGPGYAMERFAELASAPVVDPANADTIALAALLSGPAFAKARYAWTEPWATRMGWPGETYGDQLVRIVLRKEAWLARYGNGTFDVVDMDNAPVTLSDALAHPERIAGAYFVRDAGAGGPVCGGSFESGDDGYREFIIGNAAMVEEWSLGTAEIRARLESDIALVEAFFERIRPCPLTNAHSWNLDVVCGWSRTTALSELDAYAGALAMPSPGYLPAAPPLAALIETLQASLFEPNPFVVAAMK